MSKESPLMRGGTLAILGRPNVGKSTLLNTLVRQKVAIVSDKPQTTRTRIMGVAHYPGAQLVIIDTPGVHKPRHRLNRQMVKTALGTVEEADIVYVMVDARVPPGPGDQFVIDQVSSLSLSREACGVFLVLNKVDRMNKQQLLPLIERYQQFRNWTEVVPISAKTGMNVDRLLQVTLACLPENGTQGYEEDYITDQSMREMAAEFIREKILEQTRSELPYAVAVVIDQFLEEGSQARISATIVVDKASQKGIVIGKGGQRLKTIGTAARLDMEREFGLRIFLELWVKVQEGWRDNDRMLVEFGY